MGRLSLKASAQRGFTLVELMVVVAIIGMLAAIALPRFKTFQAKARQAEARTNLASVFSLEQSYQGENDTYVVVAAGMECNQTNTGTSPIGFYISDCTAPTNYTTGPTGPRYTYSVAAGAAGITTSFIATATSGNTATTNRIYPGCAIPDTWTMDHNRRLSNTSNATKACSN